MTRYELLDRIGVGGMAEIFRGKAVAAGGFEKPVAIKRILPHLSQDKRFVELLIAEAKVLSLLKHRNIVQIFDVGLGDDGQYFLVMEYVDGKDLGGVQRGIEARRRRMPFDLALHVGAEICEALEHAHTARAPDGQSMSLVHRDVSPSNVLLSRAGEVKLTDFGIAKRAEQEATGHGAVRGKFAYISPEQARNEHVDPRSDVFSVGILLWELITNRRLFSGMSDLEALRAVREAQVPRPMEIDPRLSPEIDQLLLSALARDLKKRPTAGQLGAKLRTLRYQLEVTVGDPATELAKIIETADEVERQSQQVQPPVIPPSAGYRVGPSGSFASFDGTEATVIRIRTADAFSMRDQDGTGMARARQVINDFEEEETRQAQLSSDQLRILRGNRREDSSDISLPPPSLPGVSPRPPPRSRRPTDEPTTTRPPFASDDARTIDSDAANAFDSDSDDSTRLVHSRDRMTPNPQRMRAPTAPPPLPPPGTVHNRNPRMQPMPSRPPDEPPSARGGMLPQSMPPQPGPPPLMFGQQPPMQPMAPIQQPPLVQPPLVQPPPVAPGNYPGWGVQPQMPPRGASPSSQDMFDPRSSYPQRSSMPRVAGFPDRSRKPALKPWMLVVGALVMAALAFLVTRAFLS